VVANLVANSVRVRGTHHALSPPIVDNTLDNLCARTIESVERYWHFPKEFHAPKVEKLIQFHRLKRDPTRRHSLRDLLFHLLPQARNTSHI
jgi:hypothetical protein